MSNDVSFDVSFHVVIPARLHSTRLPGKPLVDIHGQTMIERVAIQASRAHPASVIVATDNQQVVDALQSVSCQVLLTRDDHASGTDRVMEVADRLGWSDDEIVINVQGDEPLIPPEVITQVADTLANNPALDVATLCEPITDRAALFDPNMVKVVRDANNLALYFSRAPIPYARDAFTDPEAPLPNDALWWRHIGMYGYRVRALKQFVALPVAPLEATEALEQLRLMANGVRLHVEQAVADVPGGVDTPADLERVRKHIRDAAG